MNRFLISLILFVIVMLISVILKEPYIAGAVFTLGYIFILVLHRQKETT